MTLLIASITPVMIFLYLIFRIDKNKEPIGLLTKCFFGGFLSIILTLIIDVPMSYIGTSFSSPFSKSFFDAFFVAGFPEELSKFIILYWLVWKSKYFDEHYDSIVYAVFVGLGFALVENILYVFDSGLKTALLRGILSVPGHGFFAVIMGYFLSIAKLSQQGERKKYLLLSVLIPILFHGTYDFILMYATNLGDSDSGISILLLIVFTIFVIYLWRYGLKKIKITVAKNHAIQEEAVN